MLTRLRSGGIDEPTDRSNVLSNIHSAPIDFGYPPACLALKSVINSAIVADPDHAY
jgi:hypothetical protein